MKFLLAILLISCVHLFLSKIAIHENISWLGFVGRNILNGRILYQDLFEINPPLIIWFAILSSWLGKYLGVSAENMMFNLTSLLIIFSLTPVIKQLSQQWISLFFILIILPVLFYAYGEREHLFVVLMLPVILSGKKTYIWNLILATIVCCFKPHFILLPLAIWFYEIYKIKLVNFKLKDIKLPLFFILAWVIYIYSAYKFEPYYFNTALKLILKYYQAKGGLYITLSILFYGIINFP
jgi:hypothetical protein